MVSATDGKEYVVVFVTTGSAEEAAHLARVLVEDGLAACGNLLGPVRSIYRWKGKAKDESETLLMLKTRASLFEPLKERVLELHSYDVPEVVALPLVAGHEDYLDWIDSSTRED